MNTKQWFNKCLPEPTDKQACIQIGCHLEEVSEMLTALGDEYEAAILSLLADQYKRADPTCLSYIRRSDKVELLDSIVDQNVTGQGVCYTLSMNHDGALGEVERSNASKLEDGKPVFDDNGKITKGKHYTPPQLDEFIRES